ncbi:MAG: TlpA disulfide reductase family protein [Candidatus Sumerlaeia bacterium]
MIPKTILLMFSILICSCGSPETAPSASTNPTPNSPPLQVAEWIKGDPVNIADGLGKNVYLIEFWATWCPPCRRSIPHLTELQKQYKDKGLVVVGISTEDANAIRPFVDRMGDQMDYRVAIDKNFETSKAYMQANNINTIPHAFLIVNGVRKVRRGAGG